MTAQEFDPHSLPILISAEKIQIKIRQIAELLKEEFGETELVLLIIMKGALCFAADLLRELPANVTLEYLSCKSYGMKGSVSSDVEISGLEGLDLHGKTVILLDDIFDTGKTVEKVLKEVHKKKPRELKSLFLLSKEKKRECAILPDYVLFEIPDLFVVGYGMDYKELYRGLKDIRYISLPIP